MRSLVSRIAWEQFDFLRMGCCDHSNSNWEHPRGILCIGRLVLQGAGFARLQSRLNRKNALSLLAGLQKATGKDWETLDFSEKVDPGHTNRILLNFSESAWVGNTLLSPGRYTVMLTQHSENLGVLYFLAGEELDPQQPVQELQSKSCHSHWIRRRFR